MKKISRSDFVAGLKATAVMATCALFVALCALFPTFPMSLIFICLGGWVLWILYEVWRMLFIEFKE
jgi:hypothetical protein